MQEVGEVETGHMLPTDIRSILVHSRERVDGRNIFHDTLRVERIGWFPRKPEASNKQIGRFWADAPLKTTLVHEYEQEDQICRVVIGTGVDPALADHAIPQILIGKALFDQKYQRRIFEMELKRGHRELSLERDSQGYQLVIGEYGGITLHFQVKEGEVYVSSISSWNV
jgi:hypothetical protein